MHCTPRRDGHKGGGTTGGEETRMMSVYSQCDDLLVLFIHHSAPSCRPGKYQPDVRSNLKPDRAKGYQCWYCWHDPTSMQLTCSSTVARPHGVPSQKTLVRTIRLYSLPMRPSLRVTLLHTFFWTTGCAYKIDQKPGQRIAALCARWGKESG
jgi:hypothetical protein